MSIPRRLVIGLLAALTAAPAILQAQAPAGTAFTYQGQLKQTGVPLDGAADFEFTLWDDAISPDPNHLVGGPLLRTEQVTNGLFTVALDFGQGVFTGDARWLEITVNGTTLSPRQPIKPTPQALYARGTMQGFNVRDYGATGDGIADDTAAIQATIDAAAPHGGTVFFPVGVYRVTATLTVTTTSRPPGITLQGAGTGAIDAVLNPTKTEHPTVYPGGL